MNLRMQTALIIRPGSPSYLVHDFAFSYYVFLPSYLNKKIYLGSGGMITRHLVQSAGASSNRDGGLVQPDRAIEQGGEDRLEIRPAAFRSGRVLGYNRDGQTQHRVVHSAA
jgi:hypothetical protein